MRKLGVGYAAYQTRLNQHTRINTTTEFVIRNDDLVTTR